MVISAALLGRAAGITASVLSFLIFNYLFISPYYTFRVAHPQDFLAMFVLLGVAILISSLMARIQSNLDQVRARDAERVQLLRQPVGEYEGVRTRARVGDDVEVELSRIGERAHADRHVFSGDQSREVRRRLKGRASAADWFGVELLLREALTNAVLHAGSDDGSRRVRCEVSVGARIARLVVADANGR